MSDISIGVDIGLETFIFGIWKNNKVEILTNYMGDYRTPSIVTFRDNDIIIGKENYKDDNKYKKNTIYDINKIIGKKYNDKDLQENMKIWPFKIEKDLKTNKPLIVVEYKKEIKKYFPEEILSMIFNYIKSNIEEQSGNDLIKNIVLTIPLYFNELQKEAYINSAKISGLNILKLIKTTSASAFTYYDNSIIEKKKNILVLDLGNTLEISIFSIDENLIEEKASYYDINYGSNFILNELVELCINDFKRLNGIDIHDNQKAILKLKRTINNSMYENKYDDYIEIDNLINDIDFNFKLHPMEINNKVLFKSISFVLNKAKFKKEDIDEFLLVGGHAHFIKILLKDSFYYYYNKIKTYISNAFIERIAYGATIQASILNQKYYKNINLVEISSNSTINDNRMNEILDYSLNKINKEMIDLKNEIIEYKYLELNEGKIFLKELNERIENDNKDLESIKICDELIEKVKKWIKEMKIMEFEKKISILEIELKQNKNEKKIAINERNEIEKNYKILVEKYKKLQKTNK